MAHTTGRASRRAAVPLGESAGTVAVIADEAAFALMRGYGSFRFTDHPSYLRRTEALLRALARRHGHTSVALFDPVGFADFCERERLSPDSQAARARYTAEIAARGPTVAYDGQPLDRLVPELLAEHMRWETWEVGTDLLAAAGPCPRCGAPQSRCAFRRAAGLLAAALEWVPPGTHHVVCSLITEPGPLTASVRAVRGADGSLEMAEPEALVLCTLLAVGLATGDPGGLVLRSAADPDAEPPHRGEEVRGWSVRDGRLIPLTEGGVFAAYCTDVLTGEPVPPEHGVAYRAAPALPPTDCQGP
ncbi:hypothetical protein [Streptomyces radicis]|uniref:Uncharacterized protein n=1 Tax=Streptomyces radicis TaxID=1750517 RepID=A0A3A9WIF8_9ACTN|nr:hypothetical protein [Streptomyces radicis]RKN12559.1 hypothetical protein D7319_00960 [Streptomyces radicis]RKN27675.1 hypothetical protein D7318_01935 [Streptomyces radicis]